MNTEEYRKFMGNSDNVMNCSECPEKQERPSHEMPLPCGQQHCWVSLHVQAHEE